MPATGVLRAVCRVPSSPFLSACLTSSAALLHPTTVARCSTKPPLVSPPACALWPEHLTAERFLCTPQADRSLVPRCCVQPPARLGAPLPPSRHDSVSSASASALSLACPLRSSVLAAWSKLQSAPSGLTESRRRGLRDPAAPAVSGWTLRCDDALKGRAAGRCEGTTRSPSDRESAYLVERADSPPQKPSSPHIAHTSIDRILLPALVR